MATTQTTNSDTPIQASRANHTSHTSRTRIQRHPERAVPEQAEDILRNGRVAHVAFAIDGQPFVLPFTYYYEAGALYLHGAPASRTLKALSADTPVCVEVTLLDGLVASREAKSHSANYRSVVVFGTASSVTDARAMRHIFERMTDRYFPGRTAGTDYAPARSRDFKAVELLVVTIEELNAKARSGPPRGKHDADDDAPGSSFVLPLPGLDA